MRERDIRSTSKSRRKSGKGREGKERTGRDGERREAERERGEKVRGGGRMQEKDRVRREGIEAREMRTERERERERESG